MILISINEPNFEYDIHSLVQAFYPGKEVLVRVFSEAELAERASEAELIFTITYEADAIRFELREGETAAQEPGKADGGTVLFDPQSEPVLTRQVAVDPADRIETKNRLKQTLYQLLADYTGKTLPWGTLTGIRPVKIAMAMLEDGESGDAVRDYMRRMFFTSEEKIDFSLEIAAREQTLLSEIDYENGYSLYIGIPFCPSTCLYCSFPSFSIGMWQARVDEYLEDLCKEIAAAAELCAGKELHTVYIGGGTPTSLSPAQLDRLLGQIREKFHLNDNTGRIVYGGLEDRQALDVSEKCGDWKEVDSCIRKEGFEDADGHTVSHPDIHPDNKLMEFTVEAGRPDSITPEKLKVLRDHGISRISINPQTMNEKTLRLIGRNHTAAQTEEAFHLAREMGFTDINMDLIVGLPEEGIEEVRRTMDAIARLAPENVTVHSLAVKRAARLKTEHEQYEHLRIENTWETIRLTQERCRAMGLAPYYLYRQKNTAGNFENVGYAAPGREGLYNILIMEEKQSIVALGAGGTSKVVFDHGARIERSGNVKDVGQYMDRIDEMIERKRAFFTKYDW